MRKLWNGFLIVSLLGILWSTPEYSEAASAPIPESVKVEAISANGGHTLALLDDGTVMAWGLNITGQLGNGTRATVFESKAASHVYENVNGELKLLTNIVAVAAGAQYSLALSADGTVYGWGSNYSYELGRPYDGSRMYVTAVPISGLPPIEQISAGVTHAAALAKDGSVWAWGDNQLGAVGNGELGAGEYVETPVRVKKNASEYLAGVKQIVAGNLFTYAVMNNGELLGWGYNQAYQLGDGTFDTRGFPSPVLDAHAQPITGIKKVAAGGYFGLALTEDGHLYSWGANDFGQLGLGSSANKYSKYAMPVLDGVTGTPFGDVADVSTGFYHSSIIRNDGTVWTWGSNKEKSFSDQIGGQLGRGNNLLEDRPGQVTETLNGTMITKPVSIASGDSHTVMLMENGSLWSTGNNAYGQLGGGLAVPNVKRIVQVSLSDYAKAYWVQQPDQPVVGQPYKLILQLVDNQGEPVSFNTDLVDIHASGGVSLGAVSYAGQGRYTATMMTKSTGQVQIAAQINGLDVPDKAQFVVLSGEPTAANSELVAAPSVSLVGGADPVKVKLRLKDAYGNDLNRSAGKVQLFTTLGTIEQPTETSYGVYEAQLRSNTTGKADISVTLNGQPFDIIAGVQFKPGVPDSSYSKLSASPSKVAADGIQSVNIKLHIKDAYGNKLEEYVGPITMTSSLGQLGTVTESTYGVYETTLVSDKAGTATISASLGGLLLANPVTVEFEPVIKDISFDEQQYSLQKGEVIQAILRATDGEGNKKDITKDSRLSIADKTVAEVSPGGKITGITAGQTVLTAVYGAYSTTAVIHVTAPGPGGGGTKPDPNPDPNPEPTPDPTPNPNPGPNPGSGVHPSPAPGTVNDSGSSPSTPSGDRGDSRGNDPTTHNPPKSEDSDSVNVVPDFPDMKDHWAKDVIVRAVKAGKIKGYPDGTFRPGAAITRAEFVVLLDRWFGLFDSSYEFQPVAGENWPGWSVQAVSGAIHAGVLQGYADGKIRPNQAITRTEMAVMLQRVMKQKGWSIPAEASSLNAYSDHNRIPEWAREAFLETVAQRLIMGDTHSRLRPMDPVTRAETVSVLTRLGDILADGSEIK